MIRGTSQIFSPEGTPEGYAFYGKNMVINRKLDEIINEKGTVLVDAFVSAGVSGINGIIAFGDSLIIFYKTATDNIGVYNEIDKTFSVKVSRTDLAFSLDFPITGEAKLNSKGELIVAFTDKNTFPKYINLDTAAPSDSLDLYNLSLLSKNPNIKTQVLEGAGGFKTGAHFVSIAYVDKNKATGNYSPFSTPVYIVPHSISEDYRNTQGSKGGLITNKAIKLTLTNLDPSYNKIKIAVLSRQEEVVSAALYKEVTYTGTTASVVITGSEVTTPLAVEQIITVNSTFERVGEIESLNDQLFVADIVLSEVINFQKVANRIQLSWISTLYRNSLKATVLSERLYEDGGKRTFLHDEVYAFYVQFELPGGRLTDWFHIPGRIGDGSEGFPTSAAPTVLLEGVNPKRYQIEDTCLYSGVTHSETVDGNTTNYPTGTMGYWENEDEFYPANFPDYGGQRVRHHRFPSLHFMKQNVYNSIPEYMIDSWDGLGILVGLAGTGLVGVPPEFTGKFTGYRIGFAKRDVSNMTVLGYDVIQYAAATGLNSPSAIPGAGNLSSASGNWYIAGEGGGNDYKPHPSYIRMHSPDLFILRPNVENIYLANQRKYRLPDMNFQSNGRIDYGRVLWNNDGGGPLSVWSYVSNFRFAVDQGTIDPQYRYIKLNNTKFIPNNVTISDSDSNVNNLLCEEFIHGKLAATLPIQISGVGSGGLFRTDLGIAIDSPNLFEETILTAIKTLKTNLFISYKTQLITPCTDIIKTPTSFVGLQQTAERYRGDGYIIEYSFVAMSGAPNLNGPYTYDPNVGLRNIKAFLCESRFNLTQRYLTLGDASTYFYPQIGGFAIPEDRNQFWVTKLNQQAANVNVIQYSKDFNTQNDYEQYGVYDHEADYITELPFAIARSQKASRASTVEDGWRIFRPNDIFYTVRDKGNITGLVAWGTDSLLIHHQKGLFRTRDKAVLQTDVANISLGSGEIFALEPAEVSPTEYGYGGLQHRFGALLCENGYVFVDAQTGEVFLYKGGDTITNISRGWRNFFIETFKDQIIPDNPFKTGGITLGYDKDNARLILSLKAELDFTMSFDFIKEEWAVFHDYLPDFLVNTRMNLYSVKNNAIHIHNKGPYGDFYGVVYPSFVDVIVNTNPDQEKILGSIQWISRVLKEGSIRNTETITHVTIWNDTYCTGRIEVKPKIDLTDEDSNTERADDAWNFNAIKDAVINHNLPITGGLFSDYRPIGANITSELAWFDEPMMRGKYFIVRLEYSNFEDKAVSLRKLLPNLRASQR